MKARSKKKLEYNSDEILLLENKNNKILKLFGNRANFIILTLLLQIGFFVGAVFWLRPYVPFFFSGYMLTGIILVFIVINRQGNPIVKLTWSILILTLPVFGGLMYMYVDLQVGNRLMNKRLRMLNVYSEGLIPQKDTVKDEITRLDAGVNGLITYVGRTGHFPMFDNTEATYLSCGEDYFEKLIDELRKAKKFIFLEFFIIAEGYMWGKILKTLKQKVDEGVEVRIIYDGMCAITPLSYSYPKKLQALGIKCKMFSPIYPILSTHYNNRDHRKIVVIDGKVSFTGGINLADEYINIKKLYGHWKDSAVMLKGEAVKSFTLMFLQVWNVDEKVEDFSKYLKIDFDRPSSVCGYVMPYADSPVDNEKVGEMLYIDILNRAKKYVYIMTPYLILDNEMLSALSFAAKRGVDIKLILPHIPDKKTAFALAKSHYKELLQNGVSIYEYLPGFVHSKVFVSDDDQCVVGTINLDFRSLYLHYECAAYMYNSPIVAEVKKDFDYTLDKCMKVSLLNVKKEKWYVKLCGRILKLVAPLM